MNTAPPGLAASIVALVTLAGCGPTVDEPTEVVEQAAEAPVIAPDDPPAESGPASTDPAADARETAAAAEADRIERQAAHMG